MLHEFIVTGGISDPSDQACANQHEQKDEPSPIKKRNGSPAALLDHRGFCRCHGSNDVRKIAFADAVDAVSKEDHQAPMKRMHELGCVSDIRGMRKHVEEPVERSIASG